MLENKEKELIISKTIKEIVNEFEIAIHEVIDPEDNEKKLYCTVANVEDDIANYEDLYWEGYLNSKLSAVDVYHALTSERRFLYNDEILLRQTIFGSEKGGEEKTREEKACELNVPTSDILVITHKNEIYRREVISQ